MATVRPGKPRSNGAPSWRAVWFETANGKRFQRTKAFARRSEAKAFAERMAVEVEQRGVADPHKYSVGQYVRYWLDHPERRGELSDATLIFYRTTLGLAELHIGSRKLSELSARDLDDLYATLLSRGGKSRRPNPDGTHNTRPLSARTVKHVATCLSTCLEQARRWRLVSENVARDAKPPTPNPSPAKALGQDEITRLLAAAKTVRLKGREIVADQELAVLLLLTCGMRRSELLGLAFDAIDFDRRTLKICRSVVYDRDNVPVLREGKAKTRTSLRIIAIADDLVERLRERKAKVAADRLAWGRDYFAGPLLVFPGVGGQPLDPMGFSGRFEQLLKKAGIKGACVHTMRHTSASLLIANGIDIKTISTRLGHSVPSTTLNMYAHTMEGRDQAAAELMADIVKGATKVQLDSA